MIDIPKTYHLLFAVAAGVLLAGASLPLVQYVCDAADGSAAIASANVSLTNTLEDGCQSGPGCRDVFGSRFSETSASPANLGSVGSESPCCTATVVKSTQAVALLPETPASRLLLLPAGTQAEMEAPGPDDPANISSLARRGRDAAFPAGVSARLLTSVFLL